MGYRILALTENTIGAQLLLSAPLETLGHQVTVLLRPEALRERMEAETFDCVILDDTAIGTRWQQVMEDVSRCQGRAGVVWLGRPPRGLRTPLDAVFAKPLRYSEITGFFTRWMPPGEELAEGEAGESGEGPARRAQAGTPRCDARGVPVIQCDKRGRKPWLRKRS